MPAGHPRNDLLLLRTQAGLSRLALSNLSGVSLSCIFNAECGPRRIRPIKEAALREALAVAILRRKAEGDPPFSMRCRWCGDRIGSIKFDAGSGLMIIVDKEFQVFNGWFYHRPCFKEKSRIELNNSDDD